MMYSTSYALAALAAAQAVLSADCPAYVDYAGQRHEPYSSGKYALPFQRPSDDCRTYKASVVDDVIENQMKDAVSDPDLFRLFENSWPNTLDTTVLWHGKASDNGDEELTFVITGDINAMWLRDSANQLQSYKPQLVDENNSTVDSIATLYRGAINLQGRYIRQFPYCNSFQPPPESGTPPTLNKRTSQRPHLGKRSDGDVVTPKYDPKVVFECKYELDSLAAFLQLSWDYYEQTQDADFFAKFSWADTIKTIMQTANDMSKGTYADDGTVNQSPYTWRRQSDRATETLANDGAGEPVSGGIGLVRSAFRPSDDSCTFQYLIPSNMMFSRYLSACADIMQPIDNDLASSMKDMASGIKQGIEDHAVVDHPTFGKVYAYEIDGFGSFNLMDDANLPSLLSAPHLGYLDASNEVYQNTRKFALSKSNRYYAVGPVLTAPGGPHLGPGKGWPMGVIMQIITSTNDDEITHGLSQLVSSTSGLGLIHESVAAHDASTWSRPWFAWANGLFGQMLLDLEKRKPDLLKQSFQS